MRSVSVRSGKGVRIFKAIFRTMAIDFKKCGRNGYHARRPARKAEGEERNNAGCF